MIRVDSFCPYFSCNLVDEREEKNRFVGREMNAKPNFAHLIRIYFFRLIKPSRKCNNGKFTYGFLSSFFSTLFFNNWKQEMSKEKENNVTIVLFFSLFLEFGSRNCLSRHSTNFFRFD